MLLYQPMKTTLTVSNRTGNATALRAAGSIPAVVYGPKQESIAIAIDRRAFETLFESAGESTIITLEGLAEDLEVLVHDVAFNAERGGIEHIDFYAIERGKDLTTNVALQFEGEAPVEKEGAMVIKALQEVVVTCRPSALPSEIVVDLTVLTDTSATITVADLPVPEGVTVDTDAETAVATVAAAREEEPEETESTEVDMDAIDVEQKGKDEAEGDDSEEKSD